MTAEEENLPFRQATRVVNDAQLRIIGFALDIMGPHLERSLIFLAVYRNALRQKPNAIISANALSTSLNRPYESVRRNLHQLVGLGFCAKSVSNIVLAEKFTERSDIKNLQYHLSEVMIGIIEYLRSSGFEISPDTGKKNTTALARSALDIYLSTHEFSEALTSNLMDMYVTGAIAVHNASRITYDPLLSERYGLPSTVPPLDLREPLSVRALSRNHGFPYATIWRHIERCKSTGYIVKHKDGYLLADKYMNSAETNILSRKKILYVLRVIRDLGSEN